MLSPVLRVPRDAAAFFALRMLLGIPAVAGVTTSRACAGAMGHAFARARFNRKRMDRALANLRQALPDAGDEVHRDLAARAYQHLFELAMEFVSVPRLISPSTWMNHVELTDIARPLRALLERHAAEGRPVCLITGHTGNWEVLGSTVASLGFPLHALYRPLDLAPLDRWVRETRSRRGLMVLDKFGATERLPALLAAREPVGFVADQNAGDKGLFVPFFGRLASTYKSIGLVAIQTNATIVCGQAKRVDPGQRPRERDACRGLRYRLDVLDTFGPEDWRDQPDPLFYVTARYRRAIERMVLAAPEQYLWMHRIWKSRPRHELAGKPLPPALRDKLAALPWMTEADVEAVADRSARDGAWLLANNQTRL